MVDALETKCYALDAGSKQMQGFGVTTLQWVTMVFVEQGQPVTRLGCASSTMAT